MNSLVILLLGRKNILNQKSRSTTNQKTLKKKKMTKKITLENLSKLRGGKKTFKITQNLPFLGFSNCKPKYFCHFWFSIKTKFYLVYKLTFVSSKKFRDLHHQYSHNYRLVWWETEHHFLTPFPQK